MSKEEHLVYISSDYSTQDNITGTVTINLPVFLNLDGNWKCAILDFYIERHLYTTPFINILADFCQTSFIHQTKELPILKRIFIDPEKKYYDFNYPTYIRLKQNSLSDFDLTFVDSSLKSINLQKFEALLHFSKNE